MRDTIDKYAKEELTETLESLKQTMHDLLKESKQHADEKDLQHLRTELQQNIKPVK